MVDSNPWPVHIKSIISIGRYRAPRHKEIRPAETQEGTEKVELLTGGEVYFEENGRQRLFGCGGIFWHRPGEYTVHKAVPYNPYECITILFETEKNYLPSPEERTPRASRWEDPLTVKKFAGDVLEHFHAGIMDKNVLSHYIYSRLNYHIFQYHHRMTEKSRPVPLRSLLEYIDDNISGDLSLEALSAYSQLSTSHLHALFKEQLHQTPHKFIINRRLQQARSLLAGSDLRIGEICFKCGFINGETFNRCFKKAQGMTPTQFRISQRPVG
jgi:AraC-like DNA-binding protein